MFDKLSDDEKVQRARSAIGEAIMLCDALRAPLAANHIQLGLDLLELRVDPIRALRGVDIVSHR